MIKNVVREIFRVYTKTFGGKIWANLHRVSPGNIFGKNFNKASFQKLTTSRAKNRKVKANLSSLRKKNQYTVNNSMLFL